MDKLFTKTEDSKNITLGEFGINEQIEQLGKEHKKHVLKQYENNLEKYYDFKDVEEVFKEGSECDLEGETLDTILTKTSDFRNTHYNCHLTTDVQFQILMVGFRKETEEERAVRLKFLDQKLSEPHTIKKDRNWNYYTEVEFYCKKCKTHFEHSSQYIMDDQTVYCEPCFEREFEHVQWLGRK